MNMFKYTCIQSTAVLQPITTEINLSKNNKPETNHFKVPEINHFKVVVPQNMSAQIKKLVREVTESIRERSD